MSRNLCPNFGPLQGVARHVRPQRCATEQELLAAGTAARYLKQLRQATQRARRAPQGWVWLDRDKTTAVTAATQAAACRAVGAAMEAVEWAMEPAEGPRRSLVLARPPGHHNGCDERLEARERNAWRYAAHGGCVLNETAVAVKLLRAQRPGCRVAVLDLDAHFGDGTAWLFYEEADVLCVSLHLDQSDLHLFPYLKGKPRERGEGRGAGLKLNLNLKGWNSDGHRELPRSFESTNLSRDNLSREIGRHHPSELPWSRPHAEPAAGGGHGRRRGPAAPGRARATGHWLRLRDGELLGGAVDLQGVRLLITFVVLSYLFATGR